MHDQHGTCGEDAMSVSRNKHLRKGGEQDAASKPGKRHRSSPYTGRLHASRVPETRGSWPGKRGRRPSWKDVRLTQLDEACEFSSDRELSDPVSVIRELKKHPQYVEPLRQATRHLYEKKPSLEYGTKIGRYRMKGDFGLLYLAFVLTGDTSRLSFWNRYASSPIWQECGFDAQPDYEIMRLRFNELEHYWMGVRDMGRLVIQQAVRHDPEIGEFWMVDSTGWQTPAGLEHCCTDKARCRALLEKQGKRKPHKPAAASEDGDDSRADHATDGGTDGADDQLVSGGRRGAPQRLRRAPAEAIESERHREQADLEPDPELRADSVIEPLEEDETYQYFLIDGHRYRTRDKTAGLRHYKSGKGKSWFGGYGTPALDTKYGVALAAETFPADDQEWDHYPDLYESAIAATGKAPLAVSTDRGFGLKAFDEFNTRRGVATVRPFRQTSREKERADMRSDLVDEHGVPRCQHCGGEGDMDSAGLGWYLDRKHEPRIRFRCKAPATPDCKKLQSISCAEDWRLLLPLNLTQPLYHALREMHFSFERIFGHWRQRYGVFGKNASTSLRRRGVPAQRLRAQAAVFLDWFRICLRHGFLGSWRTRNTNEAQDITGKGKKRLGNVMRARSRRLLDLPYGTAAERVKLWRSKQSGPPPGDPPPDDGLPDGTFTWDDPLEGF
jgi:hypothetical protein